MGVWTCLTSSSSDLLFKFGYYRLQKHKMMMSNKVDSRIEMI